MNAKNKLFPFLQLQGKIWKLNNKIPKMCQNLKMKIASYKEKQVKAVLELFENI